MSPLISGVNVELPLAPPNTDCKMYGLLLPVPSRLHFLIGNAKKEMPWVGDAKFTNFVEIETLLSRGFQEKSDSFKTESIFNNDYFVAKDSKKSCLWKELISAPNDVFSDFNQLFVTLYNLFGIKK